MRMSKMLMATVVWLAMGCEGAQGDHEPSEPSAVEAPKTAPTTQAEKSESGHEAKAKGIDGAPEKAELGRPAPDFTLTDTEGKKHTLSSLRGKVVVLEWFNPDCPFVKAAHGKGALKTMAKETVNDGLVWLSINSGGPGKQGHGVDRNKSAKGEWNIGNPLLMDEDGKVGRAYGAEKTPHMYIVDAKGVLVYRGGIDNAPMGVVDAKRPRPEGVTDDRPFNYVRAALEALKAGRPIELADTPAYGCGVKYSS